MPTQKIRRPARMFTRRQWPWAVEALANGACVTVHTQHLNGVDAQALGDYLLGLAEEVAGGQLEVNLAAVRSLSALFLGKLIALDRRLQGTGGHLVLMDVTPEVYEVFELTHLAAVLDLQPLA